MVLIIDYVNRRFYWVDENYIEFSNMDGFYRYKG